MSAEYTCTRCGTAISGATLAGLCPRCLLRAAASHPAFGGSSATRDHQAEAERIAPRVLGDYELLEELGRGGMGVVFKARQISLNRTVALKMILSGPFASPEALERFHAEAEAAANLRHVHIVTVFDYGQWEGVPFFTMEYIEGRTLGETIGDWGLGIEDRGLRISKMVRTIAEAVHYAHQQGVLHRDLKPSNILIDNYGEPRITDFGLAKQLQEENELTQTGHLLGSPNYMSPEQAFGNRAAIGPSSDVYALGAILYELLTSRPPFAGKSITDTLRHVLEREPVSPRSLNPRVPRDLETICLKCLEKDLARRYSTAQALADDLERFQQGEPVRARPVRRVERLWRWARRKPALAGLSGATGLLLLTVLIGSPVALHHINRQRERAEANAVRERQLNYNSSIKLARQYIEQGNTEQAIDILLNCPETLRHWEWGRLLYLAHQSIVTLDHSPGEIVQLEFDPRGEFLAVVDSQGALCVWNWLEERRMSGFADATTRVTSIAFDPAGERLAAVISGAAVRIWRTRDGVELFRLGELGATTVAFSRDGWLLATAETSSHVVRVWDGFDGRPHSVLEGHTRNVQRLAFTEDARRLISQNSAEAFVWDLETDHSLVSYRVHDPVAVTLAIDPTGQHLVTIDGQGWVTLWTPSRAPEMPFAPGSVVTLDPANPALAAVQKRLIRIVSAQPELARWALFSSDGRWLCHGGDNGTARVWDVGTGEEALVIPTRVYSAVFAADGGALLTCGALTTASVWDITRRERVKDLRGHDALVGRGTFSWNRRFAATADRNDQVRIWNAGPGRELMRLRSWARGATLSRDGQSLAVSEIGLALHVFDTRSGAQRITLEPQWLEAFYHLDFSPDGDRLVATGTQKSAKVFDLVNGALLHRLGGHQRQVFTARYSPDGTRIATGSLDGTVRLWQAVNGTLEREIRIGLPGLRCNLAFSADGRRLAVGNGEGMVAVWEVETGRLQVELPRQGPDVNLAWQGSQLITIDGEANIRIWDGFSGMLIRAWKTSAPVWWLAISPDGRRIVTDSARVSVVGYDSATCEIWDAQTGHSLLTLREHAEPLNAITFSADGLKLATSSFDMTARLWEAFPWSWTASADTSQETLRDQVRSHARRYWRQRVEEEATAWENPSGTTVKVPPPPGMVPARDSRATSKQLDLSPHYTGILTEVFYPQFGVFDLDNELSEFPGGIGVHGGVTFDVCGVIALTIREATGVWREIWNLLPDRCLGIRVEDRFTRLHVLHATAFAVAEGTPVAALILHYDDGTRVELDLVYGQHVRNWWQKPGEPSEVSHGKVVWQGNNPIARAAGATLRLYLSTLDNPHPDRKVTHLDFVSKGSQAVPFVVALTID